MVYGGTSTIDFGFIDTEKYTGDIVWTPAGDPASQFPENQFVSVSKCVPPKVKCCPEYYKDRVRDIFLTFWD